MLMSPFLALVSETWIAPVLALYTLLFMAVVLCIGMWSRRRRRERIPVEFKLLRGPGETLRRKIAVMDEDFIFYVFAGAVAPIVVSWPALWLFAKWQLMTWTDVYFGGCGVVLVFLLSSILSGRWLWRKFSERRNYLLGYLGERTVAEALTPLLREGYHVFHDLPAVAGDRKFNIDHIAVGPTGLFVVETKTRRKGRARAGFKDHEVTFNGQQLIWPWGEDRHGLEQAEAEARWLGEWLQRMTGLQIAAKPILALPGWYVKATARGTVNVVNAKNLPIAIKGRGQRTLTDEQINLIARQVENLCRDVED